MLVDEFGSQFDSNVEKQCFHDIVAYMNNAGGSSSYGHSNIESWFYWCAQARLQSAEGLLCPHAMQGNVHCIVTGCPHGMHKGHVLMEPWA